MAKKKRLPTEADVLKMGLEEGEELLDKLDQDCVSLENDPKNKQLINDVFRSVHTLKATSGFMKAQFTTKLLQNLEALLSEVREEKRAINQDIMSLVFESSSRVRENFNNLSQGKEEDISTPLIKSINDFLGEKTLDPRLRGDDREEYGDDREQEEVLDTDSLSQTIRIDSAKLDEIMNVVGELITARNQLETVSKELKSQILEPITTFMNRIVTQLQGEIMDLRMLPIARVFTKFPRVVRDISVQLGKKVNLEITGEKTALDKTIVDSIYDPLMHLVRNAVSHGIEEPAERKNNKKDETGLIKLISHQEQDSVIISVSDDGQGMNPEFLKKIAIQKKFITREQASVLSNEEAYNLIFIPGFSALSQATEISGRGVGMDAVKTSIGRLNGTINIESKLGVGTKITLKLPLTLIIQPVMEIRIASELYAIPLVSVQEVFAVNKKDIQGVYGTRTAPYRGSRVPIVRLEEVFNLLESEESKTREVHQLVVLQAGEETAAIMIDEIIGREEIVVKPLGNYLGEVNGLGGITVLGTGRAILILDVFSLVKLTKKSQRGSSPLTNQRLPDRTL